MCYLPVPSTLHCVTVTAGLGSVGGFKQLKLKTASSCGSEIHCAWSSIIHKGTQNIWSDFNKAF